VVDRAELEARLLEILDAARELGPDAVDHLRRLFDEHLAAGAGVAETTADQRVREWHGMLYASAAMEAVCGLVRKFARATAPVLIRGESGTGKDLIAKALHAESGRAGPLVSENCAAIPESLLESTLFGHKKGAFTGAVKDHPGHFVAADKGTLFLDEIGDMPLAMQVKLLRALQEGEVRPVGGTAVRKVDVRVIAATHQDLEAKVGDGSFREDLFYRLNVLRLELPALRDRDGDAVLLARRLLAAAAQRNGRELSLSPAAEELVRAAPWPGNIRQLQNEMQRVATLADGPVVQPDDFTPGLAPA